MSPPHLVKSKVNVSNKSPLAFAATTRQVLGARNWVYRLLITLCLKKNVPPLQLAIIFTYTVRLRQFLAQMLPRK